MKSRTVTVVVCVLYLVIALFAGSLHHHDSGTLVPDGHCAACAWHICNVASVPLVSVPVPIVSEVEIPLLPFHSATPRTVFFLPSASRAPPVTRA